MIDLTSRYEPFLIEVTEDDRPFQDAPITSVVKSHDGWTVTADGWTCFVPRLPIKRMSRVLRKAIVPKVGDRLRLYGRLGYPIEGIAVNDAVVFYRDEEMRAASRRRYLEERDAEQRRSFSLNKAQMDADYDALPEIFRSRIDRFRAENPDFRHGSEGYEVFCLSEAVKIADWCEAEAAVDRARRKHDEVTPLSVWDDAVHAEKPEGSIDPMWGWLTEAKVVSDGHSNNTFGGALTYSRILLQHRAGEDVAC